ncbi:MAG: peptidylprolyl isomerase [candidate division KSB1 bacterium]|nr:peptidylprolyl isomerase [candidate division KSB1 bacterium]MDZ7274889.1 peptidylprolyl isomerase [candidate division KSB1 bacterium]MDZ7286659.1 peptidylprolyl isomerase [candidate division KSB1 bacterium]MDZ7299178.1 peptidylprolyl isomerase [candidate division KSB1 bacterium]MDZ7307012.1 peptidylprolyl isomerase [candidate division KSB1 bacterium]
MKQFVSGLLVGMVISLAAIVLAQEGFFKGKVVFVKVAQENLRKAPGGEVLGSLNRGAPMQILAVEDKWLQVVTAGYIWKESVTGDERLSRGEQPYRAAMILVKTEAEALDLLKQIQAGADFQKLAAAKSIGPNAARGGDLGDAFKGEFTPAFEQAILALKVGEVSQPIKTDQGYCLFKRLK